jgi:hypothetical protein
MQVGSERETRTAGWVQVNCWNCGPKRFVSLNYTCPVCKGAQTYWVPPRQPPTPKDPHPCK